MRESARIPGEVDVAGHVSAQAQARFLPAWRGIEGMNKSDRFNSSGAWIRTRTTQLQRLVRCQLRYAGRQEHSVVEHFPRRSRQPTIPARPHPTPSAERGSLATGPGRPSPSATPSPRPGHPRVRAIPASGPSPRPGHPRVRAIPASGHPAGPSPRPGTRPGHPRVRAPGRSRSRYVGLPA